MEGCYAANSFDPMNAPARPGQRLAKEGTARAVAEQDQSFGFDQRDMLAGDFRAGSPVLVGHSGAGRMETG